MLKIIFLTLNFINQIASHQICTTEVCYSEAKRIKSKIDSSVSPCNDFYQFACGKYEKKIPAEEIQIDEFSKLQNELNYQLNISLSEPLQKDDIQPVKSAKKFYQSCMDQATINKIGVKPIEAYMKALGGWPVIKSHKWDEKSWFWQQFVQNAQLKGGSNFLFSFTLIRDLRNTSRRIFLLDQPAFGLSKENLLKGYSENLVRAYHSLQIDLAVMLGAERKDAEKEMKEVLNFEIALANISKVSVPNTKTYSVMTVKDLQQAFPCIYWLNFINSMLERHKRVDKSEILLVSTKEFFINYKILLLKTPKRTTANYVMWRVLQTSSLLLSDNIRGRILKFTSLLNGSQKHKPRWLECVSWTSNYLPIATASVYVRKYFNKNAKKDAREIVDVIRQEFQNTLQKSAWMDAETRRFALEKLRKMDYYIGYPEELKEDTKLIEYYKGVAIKEKELFNSVMKLLRFTLVKGMVKFREPVNNSDWTIHSASADVNAFYTPTLNSMEFPAGILQGQFFNPNRPKSLNYGAIGFIIGHELTHGFDNRGGQYDGNGNLFDWWQKSTKKAFLEKSQCFIHQYGNYTEPLTKLKVDGTRTLGENIADNGGLLTAYYAYKRVAKIRSYDPTLPGLNYTSNQLFWIAAAQTFCQTTRVEYMRFKMFVDPHSPSIFRINGAMGNSEEFLKDFKCSKISKMNLKNKCKVW